MRVFYAVLFTLTLGSSAWAADWTALNGPEISEALSERSLRYTGATQVFYSSGRTFYDSAQPSWGHWRVEGDQYCSKWPPADSWECFKVSRSGNGQSIRFLDADNRPVIGTFYE